MVAKKQEAKKLPGEKTKEPAVEEQNTKEPVVQIKDEPEVMAAPTSPWEKVEMLSDDEMIVEAVNIHAYQRSAMLLRFRVDGKLLGNVQVLDRMHYKAHDGSIKAR